jgi:hypothetical protein
MALTHAADFLSPAASATLAAWLRREGGSKRVFMVNGDDA